MVKNAGSTRDRCSTHGCRRSPGVGNGNLLQYSHLENSMGGGVWQTTVHGPMKSQIWPSDWAHMHTKQIYQRILKIPSKIVLLASSNKSSQSLNSSGHLEKKNAYFPEHLIWCQHCFDKGNTTEKNLWIHLQVFLNTQQ